MANAKVVYNDFAPSSAELAPLAADYTKAASAAQKALDAMRIATFNVLLKAKRIDEGSKDRFRVGARWGKWSWWLAEEGKTTAAKGEAL